MIWRGSYRKKSIRYRREKARGKSVHLKNVQWCRWQCRAWHEGAFARVRREYPPRTSHHVVARRVFVISAGIPGAGHDGPGQDIAEALVHHERAAAVFPEITFRTIVPSKIAPAKRGRGTFRRGNPWKKAF